MDKLISIIMPALNVEKFISEAIRSVLAQTYTHWELLVIDNGSTDKTLTIAESFSDKRIQILQQPIPGVSNARNLGLDCARGQFVCFLDADDWLSEQSLELRLQLLSDYPEYACCDGAVTTWNENKTNILRRWKPKISGNVFGEMTKLQPKCFITITWMIRRENIVAIRFPTEWTHLEDRIFFLEIAKNSAYHSVDETIYHFRRRKNSSMSNHVALETHYEKFMTYVQPYLTPTEIKTERALFHSIFFRTYLKGLRLRKAWMHFSKYIFN